jgi:hypothetical protein
LPRGRPLIPGLVNTYSLTDDPMILLATMDLEARHIVHGAVHEQHWRKEGEHHGRGGCSCEPFIPGDLLVMLAELQANLPLDHGIHQQPHHREPG